MKKRPVIYYLLVGSVLMIVLIVVIRAIRVANGQGDISDPTGFLSALYAWKLQKEGGLADGNTGGDRKLKRSPWIIVKNGETYRYPHTNKGITYSVFLKYAPKFGYATSKEVFADMPFDLWKKIFNAIAITKGLTYTKNLVLASYIGLWYWGSGSISSSNRAKIRSILKSYNTDGERLDLLINLRKAHFAALHQKDPVAYPQSLVDSWNRVADSFDVNFSNYLAA